MNESLCESLVDVDFDSFDIDDQVDVKIASVKPDDEYADDRLFDYEFPKQIKIKFTAHVYIDQGSACTMFGTSHKVGGISFGIEVPDQEIEVDYVRINVLTDEREMLTAKHTIKDFKVATNELSERKPSFSGKFYGGLLTDHLELYNKTLYFQYE